MKEPQRKPDGTTPLPRHRFSWRRPSWTAYARFMAHTNWPIFVGPWRGEIGFESLYWIPFIDEFVNRFKIDPARIIPISRGGAAAWYGAPQGFELYGMRTAQQIRVQNRVDIAKTGTFKQVSIGKFDRAIINDAAETMKIKRYHLVHPAWMYHCIAPYWVGRKGTDWVGERLRFRLLAAPEIPGTVFPETFVCVKFYSRMTFPANHKSVHKFIMATLEQMTSGSDVVILDTGHFVDDHSDMTNDIKGNRIHHLRDLIEIKPENNLIAQSAALGRAYGFVGTYGGFAQLALRMGKPSTSFYIDWSNATSLAHKSLADALSIKMGVPSVVLALKELPMLQTVLPVTEMQQPTGPSPLALQTA